MYSFFYGVSLLVSTLLYMNDFDYFYHLFNFKSHPMPLYDT